tara:strand:- start:335 stop:841 length:507 start_codon:yes stop_codon:yes gene_type:complete
MTTRNLRNNLVINSLIVFLIFLLDRLSKIYVINLDKKSYTTEIFSSKFLNIQLIWNEGIAFGLFSLDEKNLYNLLTIFIFIIILIILNMAIKSKGLKKYAFLLILSGALGNICDRIIYKAVPDFIDFHVGNFHWFIFNVSDIFITLGVILLIIIEISNKPQNETNEKI